MKTRGIFTLIFMGCLGSFLFAAGSMGFEDEFALSQNREETLKKLIPGSRDYYYYHLLHYQNTKQHDKARQIIREWDAERSMNTPDDLELRQAFLEYDRNPHQSLQTIIHKLGLHYNHQQKVLDPQINNPTRINSSEYRAEDWIARHSRDVSDFSQDGLRLIDPKRLSDHELTQYLNTIARPDIPGLPALVVKDMERFKTSFGARNIHKKLFLEQLLECRKLLPKLENSLEFHEAVIERLAPPDGTDFVRHPELEIEYLKRVADYVKTLPEHLHNLKVLVHYHLLRVMEENRIHDLDLLSYYLSLPRNVDYLSAELSRLAGGRHVQSGFTLNNFPYPAVRNDKEQVFRLIAHFFEQGIPFSKFEDKIERKHLLTLEAETKLMQLGDSASDYTKRLEPGELKSLRDRIILRLENWNPKQFVVNEKVTLDLECKNTPTLFVNIYELDSLNFYLNEKKEPDLSIDLDGLVPNQKLRLEYDNIPLIKKTRTIELPGMMKRGIWVVEFIGNGISCRAMIRKGELRMLERASASGHVMRILDENRNLVSDAVLWMDGHRYEANKDGEIRLPFTSEEDNRKVVLQRGDFAALAEFRHLEEEYRLNCGFFLEHEDLRPGEEAVLLFRPDLLCGDFPADFQLLKDAKLEIQSYNLDGVSSSVTFDDLQLSRLRESTAVFRVPERCNRVTAVLTGRVKRMDDGKYDDLSNSFDLTINEIDKTNRVDDIYLSRGEQGFVLRVLGKSGESRKRQPLALHFKNRYVKNESMAFAVMTDEHGRVELGDLRGVESIQVGNRSFHPHHRESMIPNQIHHLEGGMLRLPLSFEDHDFQPETYSLIELRKGSHYKDLRSQAGFKDGYLEIRDLKVGSYELYIEDRSVAITVLKGEQKSNWLTGESSALEQSAHKGVHLLSFEKDSKHLRLQLDNHDSSTRVHIAGLRLESNRFPFESLALPKGSASRYDWSGEENLYASGKRISDESRYILERQNQKHFPGNMLKRPSLILNPWDRNESDAVDLDQLGSGEGYANRAGKGRKSRGRWYGASPQRQTPGLYPQRNLDFLAHSPVIVYNLRPDRDGVLSLPLSAWEDSISLHVAIVNEDSQSFSRIALREDEKMAVRDLRLLSPLPVDRVHLQKQEILPLRAGETLDIPDTSLAEFEMIDSLSAAYAYLLNVRNDSELRKFEFLTYWTNLSREEKLKKLDEYACHELHFFIYMKDRDFFDQVLRPYLIYKKDKTFMDEWLLGMDLRKWVDPRNYRYLNTAERVLLSFRLGEQQASLRREILERVELVAPNPDKDKRLFELALNSGKMDVSQNVFPSSTEIKMNDEPKPSMQVPADKIYEAAGEEIEEEMKESSMVMGVSSKAFTGGLRKQDLKARDSVRQLYRKAGKTREWAESNYWHLFLKQQGADLIQPDAFWAELARHGKTDGFLPKCLGEAAGSFAEAALALSLIDLPFKAADHESKMENNAYQIRIKSNAIAFLQRILPADMQSDASPLMLSRQFIDPDNRSHRVKGIEQEIFVTGEMLTHKPYICRIVAVNPTGTRRQVEILRQLPEGSMPLTNSPVTDSNPKTLNPYQTVVIETQFYFPAPGNFRQTPESLSHDFQAVAATDKRMLNVVERYSEHDKNTWDWISQFGSEDEVMQFLQEHNLRELDLSLIAFRMKEKDFFLRANNWLKREQIFHPVLLSYGLKHDVPEFIRNYFTTRTDLYEKLGPNMDSTIFPIDETKERLYEHLEYWPFINPRVHPVGGEREITNDQVLSHLKEFVHAMSYKAKLDDGDRLAAAAYLLLQERVDEAKELFATVNPRKLETLIQYDYFRCFMAFYDYDLALVRDLAEKWKDTPVLRWRELFNDVLTQLDEAEGKSARRDAGDDRDRQQEELANTAPSFDLESDSTNSSVHVSWNNLSRLTLRIYPMDIEVLFSKSPSFDAEAKGFSYIQPADTLTVDLESRQGEKMIELPETFRNRNVVVQVEGAGLKKTQVITSHSIKLLPAENYGFVSVYSRDDGKLLPAVYVKVYAETKGGQTEFYKDGYTDIRGRFNYTNLNKDMVGEVEKFHILVKSRENGALVRSFSPPRY